MGEEEGGEETLEEGEEMGRGKRDAVGGREPSNFPSAPGTVKRQAQHL